MSAFDSDDRDNGKVTYSIAEEANVGVWGAFHIDRVSGDIRSNITLDREAEHLYDFKVKKLLNGA